MAWFTVAVSALHWTANAPAAYSSSPGVVRRFCGRCGTSLTYEAKTGEVDVTTCSLDDAAAVPPRDHTHADGRLPWTVIADGLPVYPRAR